MAHEGRREATRAAMRADRVMPVFWTTSADAIARARAAGRTVYAIEDVGDAAPWECDLSVPALFVIGGERHGIPPEVHGPLRFVREGSLEAFPQGEDDLPEVQGAVDIIAGISDLAYEGPDRAALEAFADRVASSSLGSWRA